jgi:hypothetical protein
MVKGLDTFRDAFAHFTRHYALIGGTACGLLMEEAGLEFRVTKDLDIVLFLEEMDADFVHAFWNFIEQGAYQVRHGGGEEKRQYYRFQKPQNHSFPIMLELFSRKPDLLDLAEGSHLTPLPIDEEISSLSAILLDEDYYTFCVMANGSCRGYL